jgi:hypothetical protein
MNTRLSKITLSWTLLFLPCLPAASAVTLPLYNGLSGTIQVPGSPVTSFEQSGFHVQLLARSRVGATSSSYYFSSGGYAYGSNENRSEVVITRVGGGNFTYESIQHWAFQGSLNATLIVEGYAGDALAGQESYSLATAGQSWSYGSTYQQATAGGLSGKPVDRLVLLPNFTSNPTNQSGFANLTVTPGLSSPTVASPTSAQVTSTSAILGGDVTNDGGSAVTERGVVYSITAANADPVADGDGVTKIACAGTTGVFSVTATGLAAGTGYSFKAYAVNGGGTTYTSPASTFTTPTALEQWRLTYFGTTDNTETAADTFDADGDGLVNLVEYAFGLDPTKGSSVSLPQGQPIGDNFVVAFTQPANVSGITYSAEWSTTLTGVWDPIADSGTGGSHIFSVPSHDKTKLFVRFKVTKQ